MRDHSREQETDAALRDDSHESDRSRIGRVADRTGETLSRAKDGMAASASGLADVTRDAARRTASGAGRAVEFVREAETDTELKERVSDATENQMHRAGLRLSDAAPTIGRGAEFAAEKVGAALHLLARPLAVVIGAIAGTVGGWWKKAAHDSAFALPEADEEACRAHFTTVVAVTPDMTYDRARTGYALGYLAARNPEYSGRAFEDIEPDLRHGFSGGHASEYDALREFTRYGYGRGAGGSI